MAQGYPRAVESEPPTTPAGGGSDDGSNGNLTRHRLNELERRMGNVERKVDDLTQICTRIETRLDNLAPKSFVLQWFGITVGFLLVSIAAHAAIRAWA